jgi:hypothetical protein
MTLSKPDNLYWRQFFVFWIITQLRLLIHKVYGCERHGLSSEGGTIIDGFGYSGKYLGLGKGKAIPVTGHEGPYGCETSRLPHFLDSRLTDGGEVVSLTHQLPFTPRKIPGTHFC